MSDPVTTFDLVSGNFDRFRNYANSSLATATEAMSALSDAGIGLVNTAANYALGVPSILPEDEALTTPDFTPTTSLPNVGPPPAFNAPTISNYGNAPELYGSAPNVSDRDTPDPFNEPRPVFTDTLLDVEDVPAPDVAALIDAIDLPSIVELSFPDPPALVPLAFTDTLPDPNIRSLDEYIEMVRLNVNVDTDAYADALLVATKNKIDSMIAGGTGLPLAIQNALFNTAVDREEANTLRAVDEVAADFASRGYDIPPGAMAAATQRVRNEAAARRSGVNRDLTIKMAEIEIESVKFAVAQGVALNGVLIEAHIKRQELMLQFEQLVVTTATSVFNTEVARHNYYVEVYKAKADVFRTRVEAQLKEVEIYRAQVDAEGVKATANRNAVEAYIAQLSSVKTHIDLYVAQLEAENSKLQQNAQKIELFKQRVSTFGELARVHALEWEGFAAQINADRARVDVFDAQVRAYGEGVRAWATKANTAVENARFKLAVEQLEQTAYASEIEHAKALIAAYSAEFEAEAARYNAQTGRINAELNASAEQARLHVADKGNEAQFHSDSVRSALAQMSAIADVVTRKYEAVSRTAAQLAAASLSGISVQAGVSASSSYGIGYNKSASFEGASTVTW